MTIASIQKAIIPILKKYDIIYAGIFGSFARGEETSKSDVDLMIHLGSPMGMISYMRFLDSLETILKRKVDVVTEKSINKRVKPYIMGEIKTIYEK